ncbi:MAG TPA: hypothetical protein VK470_17630 [Bacteroidota bacterium]|nr:hypothetical protein [Bacteroidota bacterium]
MIRTVLRAGAIVVLGVQLVCAQDYRKTADVITQIEQSLKMMIEREGAPRKNDLATIKEQVDRLKSMIAASQEQADSLNERGAQKDHRSASVLPGDDASVLALQVSSLLNEMKKTIEDGKAAQAAVPKSQPVSVSGMVYSYYTYSMDGVEGKDANRFDLDRLYLTAKSQLFDGGKFQFTTDVYRNTVPGSYYNGLGIRVKYGFLDLALAGPLSLKFGMIPTHWAGFIDQYWKYRGVSATIVDRQSYFSSADLGASLTYALPGKFGELSLYVLNGSGYTNPESNRFKDAAVRLNVAPFPESPGLKALTIAGYAYKGAAVSAASTALKRDRIGGMVSYSTSLMSATGEYHVRKDALTSPDTITTGNGMSIFGEVKAPFELLQNKFSLVWRVDIIDPNLDKGDDRQRLAILGLSYKMNDRVNFVADYQGTKAESDLFKRPDGEKTDADKRWFLHLIVTY